MPAPRMRMGLGLGESMVGVHRTLERLRAQSRE